MNALLPSIIIFCNVRQAPWTHWVHRRRSFFLLQGVFFNLYDIKRLKMALFSSEQDYYQCLGKLHWNKLVLITIILPVYIKSFPIVVKTLLGYVVWWTRDQTHESRGYPTRWSDYSQIESYRYSRCHNCTLMY